MIKKMPRLSDVPSNRFLYKGLTKISLKIFLILLCIIVFLPNICLAFSFKVNIAKQDDGTFLSDFFLNEESIWRLEVLSDGTRPVATSTKTKCRTIIIPQIIDGKFLFKIYTE